MSLPIKMPEEFDSEPPVIRIIMPDEEADSLEQVLDGLKEELQKSGIEIKWEPVHRSGEVSEVSVWGNQSAGYCVACRLLVERTQARNFHLVKARSGEDHYEYLLKDDDAVEKYYYWKIGQSMEAVEFDSTGRVTPENF